MSVGSTGGTTYNYTENFTTGVAALPQADLNDGKVIMQGPSICFFSNATPAQKVALGSSTSSSPTPRTARSGAFSTGYNPVRTSSFSDPVYTTRTDTTGAKGLVKTVADFLADSANHYSELVLHFSPAFKGSSTARVQMGALMGSVMLGTEDR
jgi:hypothetical protein